MSDARISDEELSRVRKIAQSAEGQRLIELLQGQNNQKVQSVMDQASAGNFNEAGKLIQGLLANSEIKTLVEQIRGEQ